MFFKKKAKVVASPMVGEAMPLAKSSDPVHQEEMLGKGALLMPTEGAVYAPFNGAVEMVFETCHALGLKSDDGVELLIHVGYETVKLNGKHYKALVKDNQAIKQGDKLLEFDIAGIQADGYKVETPVIVTNSGDFESITLAATGAVTKGATLLEIK